MSSPNDENANAGKGATAAEIRRDLRGEVVIVSPGRAGRPYDFSESAETRLTRCPFCPGHEDQTPPEVDAVREDGSAPDGPGWTVRVVPNKYPAFPREPGAGAAWGVHEAIIESHEHERGLADMPVDHVGHVLGVYQRRLLAARADERIEYGCIFKNHGAAAGASLEHPHSQLMAVPFVPRRIAEEVDAHRQGAFAAKLAAVRPVAESEGLAAFCPMDARLPHEVWIAPKQASQAFEKADPETVTETARLLSKLLRAMNEILDRPPFHLLLYTAPFRDGAGFSWRIEIVPRMARIAGFELATGIFVNQTAPEKAAAAYRQQLGKGQ